MKLRHLPFISSLALIGIFTALWFYALHATENSPSWFPYLTTLAILTITVIGAGAAAKSDSSLAARSLYIIGALLILAGVGSLYIFNAPTTINIFGFLSIAVGVIETLITSLFIALTLDKNEAYT